MLRTQNQLLSNPRSFWKFVKELKNNNNLPMEINLESRSSNNKGDIATFFADHFSSSFCSPNVVDNSRFNNLNEIIELSNCNFSVTEIFEALLNIGLNPSPGPDSIPPLFLYECRYPLSIPIHFLFSLSLNSGIFPCKWKLSYVFPLWKSGNKSEVNNYRAISKLSALPKLLDKLVELKISVLFKNILVDEQHGFRKMKSTETNLIVFYSHLIDVVKSGGRVDAIYTDFRKAFDSVDHGILMLKLKKLGISDPLLSWFSSYLSNRSFRSIYINTVIITRFKLE